MTKTARDLRSAAHALRTAANALEETVTALRALSDDLNEPDPEPEPEPVWPTAPLVWWGGKVWERCGEWGYKGVGAYWRKDHLSGPPSDIRAGVRRFAREAVPAVVVPAAEWEVFAPLARGSVTSGQYTLEAARALVRAADAQEVAR